MNSASRAATADFWNERYESEQYTYGTASNAYFRRQLDLLLLETFSPRQLGLPSGSPKTLDALYEPADLVDDFAGLQVFENRELGVVLREGTFHAGPAQVVRLLARSV